MMPNVSRGGRMAGLVAYLLGAGRHNEHTDQRVIAGDSVVMAWHGEETPSRESARSLARYLDEPSTVFGTTITAPITRWDEASGSHVKVGEGDAHVWHCSLSLRAGGTGAGAGACTTRLPATRSPSRRPCGSHRQASRPSA